MVRKEVTNGIEWDIVSFKSDLHFFIKEQSGLKSNTVRKLEINDLSDTRFDIIQKYKNNLGFLQIEIIENLPEELIGKIKAESFIRVVKDISYFDNYVIITWWE